MFSKPSKPGSQATSLSVLAADCRLTGDMSCEGEVHIDGKLDGDMACQFLIIGETGVVTGKITADLVRVLGTVNGQIKSRSVELGKTSRVVGDITHFSLSVEAGAYVQGVFTRMAVDTPTALPGSGASLPAPANSQSGDGRIAVIGR